ncbi:MAG: NfeD family protein [Phycisphaerales bacterium JB065]
MSEFLFENGAAWFSVPALIGTLFFAIRIVMALVGLDFDDGGGGDGGVDISGDAGVDTGIDEGMDHAESTSVFKFLSIQTVTAFAMGFGWGGMLGLKTFKVGIPESIGIGLLLGVAFAWFVVWCFRTIYALESSGNISIQDAMNTEGTVATTVQPGRSGRVRLTIGDRQRSFTAITEGEALPAGTRIRVTKVNSNQTVTVVRA